MKFAQTNKYGDYERNLFMNYTIGAQIGDTGGFGSVHVCYSENGEKYAIKQLKNMDAAASDRFAKEIRLITRLSHPNIIKIIAFNTDGDRKFYIMPIYNSSLRAIIPYLYGNYARQYKVISEILSGVAYLHSEGVLHRDLKPENILYNSDSDIVINDFGFSRQINSESTRLTQYGDAFGTYKYTAPEQFKDACVVNEKADIYSLGKIIKDIVTNGGQYEVPMDDMKYVINKCTDENPNRRFNSVSELKDTIDNIYQRVFGLVETDIIDNLLLNLQLGVLDTASTVGLANRLLSCNDNDKLEKFFRNISNTQYTYLEAEESQLIESLITRLQKHFTSQAWGFGYTDIIGDNCNRLYGLSHNVVVKANLLFAIIEVGISHNRWHVMGIASYLLASAVSNIPECTELAELLSDRNVYLGSLNIDESTLPSCLKPFYSRNYSNALLGE